MKVRTILVSLVLSLLCTFSQAQKVFLGFSGFPTVAKDYAPTLIVPHSGVRVSYTHGSRDQLVAGIHFRSVPWGSEVSLSEGYIVPLMSRELFRLENATKLHLGLPLFYNKLSVSGGISNEVTLRFERIPRIFLGGGLRFNVNPSYRIISEKYAFLESVFTLNINLSSRLNFDSDNL